MMSKVIGLAKSVREGIGKNNSAFLTFDINLLKNKVGNESRYIGNISEITEKNKDSLTKEVVYAVQWNFNKEKQTLPIVGELYVFDGEFGEYQGKKQFVITVIKDANEHEKKFTELFLELYTNPFCDLPTLKVKLEQLISLMKSSANDQYTQDAKNLWDSFAGSKYYEMYLKHPGAVFMHHSYLNGLLQHSIEVANISLKSFEAIEDSTQKDYYIVSKSLLIIGSLFHDIGKLMEIGGILGFANKITDEGMVIGHINSSIYILQELFQSTGYVYQEDFKLKLLNTVISHHRLPEFGSSVDARSLEALIVQSADLVSSRIGMDLSAIQGSDNLVESNNRSVQLYRFTKE